MGRAGAAGRDLKFVIYTMVGSLLMLAAIIVFGLQQGTFDLMSSGTSSNIWIFLGFAAAFAVKAPLFPFHGWLPTRTGSRRRRSPPCSRGWSRRRLRTGSCDRDPEVPRPDGDAAHGILVLAAIGLVYGSLIAFRAPDFRGVVAYSSLAQMGLITLGSSPATRSASTAPCCR